MKLVKGKIVRVKDELYPLYKKRDKFKIIKINKNKYLTPIEAIHLKSRKVYGFYRDELE